MGFGGSVQAMIDSIKFNARPKRNVFRNEELRYNTTKNVEPEVIQDSMDFRKNRMNNSVRRSYFIWLTILIITVTVAILFPYL